MRINKNATMGRKCLQQIVTVILSLVLTFPVTATEKLVLSAVSGSPLLLPVCEILRQAYQSIGIDLEVIPYPGLRSLRYANSGVTDGELFGDQEIEIKNINLMRVDIPLREANIYLFTKKENAFDVDGWQSIPNDYVVGYIRGVKFVENALNENNIASKASNNTDQLFLMLDRERTQVVVSGKKRGMKYTSDSLSMGIVVLEPTVHISRVFHYLHKKHAHLIPAITEVLTEMEESGRIDEIFQQVREEKK